MEHLSTSPGGPPSALDRRGFLRLAGLAAASCTPLVSSCGSAGTATSGPAAADLSGAFDWKQHKGATVRLLLSQHPYTEALKANQRTFTGLTGIELQIDELPESEYFGALGAELAAPTASYDAFMLGAYMAWDYGPLRQLEDLGPWMRNAAATSDEFRPDDFLPNLLTAGQWSFRDGDPLGGTQQWVLPWGFETNVVAYRSDVFDTLGLRPAETFEELRDVADAVVQKAPGAGFGDMYGIAVRGTREWSTVHAGFVTMYARMGLTDFEVVSGRLVPRMNTPAASAFTRDWTEMIRSAGARDWPSYTWQMAGADLGSGAAAMLFDADNNASNQNIGTPAAGKIAWHPGPKGPDGSLATNLWMWSLGMNAASTNKPAAWWFLQWATGVDHLTTAAVEGQQVDAVRRSVASSAGYRDKLGALPGYLETFTEVSAFAEVVFTPQRTFFDATTAWAGALQDVYAGADAQTTLDALARHLDAVVAGG